MNPYLVDLRDILEAPGLSLDVQEEYPLAELVVGGEVFPLTGPVSVAATITNAGEGYVLTGSVAAEVNATCSRCLCEFHLQLEGELEGLWVRPTAETTEDVSGFVSENGAIDLSEALLAGLVVEVPFAPVHDLECAGLCPTCGADLNVEACDCADVPDVDHPFASLSRLLSSTESDLSAE